MGNVLGYAFALMEGLTVIGRRDIISIVFVDLVRFREKVGNDFPRPDVWVLYLLCYSQNVL